MYAPNREPLASELEKISEKTGYGLSKNDEKLIGDYCRLSMEFVNLYDYMKESLLKKNVKQLPFKNMKLQLKEECPKHMVYDLGKTEDSEFSEYIFAYIIRVTKKWDEIQIILDIHG